MTQADKARLFAGLHRKGDPVFLYNIWDAGGARAVAECGAEAIATGSWSVAAAHGFEDGELVPLDLVLTIISHVATAIDLPLTVDFEGGYADDPDIVATNVLRLAKTGAVGLNFEDQRVGRSGLHEVAHQQDRLRAVRQAGDDAGIGLFINARTDLFLQEPDRTKHAALLNAAKERGVAYGKAGANGFFVPGLVDPDLIAELCDRLDQPVNIMMMDGAPSIAILAECGVGRISCGPAPYLTSIGSLKDHYRNLSPMLGSL